ncbi:MAG TPA: hypothetical protein VHN15_08945 [Thermoanaerobaculia bacterium]|nr:hypothetical protein [Thermoanaerobaculia bacterium]
MKNAVRTVLSLCLPVLAVPAGASTFLALSQQELAEQADAVVLGKVLTVDSYWNAEGTLIVTEAMVEVQEKVLGETPEHVRLLTFGGEVADYKIEAHGFPTFEKGERLLVYLEPARNGFRRVLGYQQGQYRIRKDKQGKDVAVPALDLGAHVVLQDGTAAPAPRAVALDQLKSQIRDAAAQVGRTDVQDLR